MNILSLGHTGFGEANVGHKLLKKMGSVELAAAEHGILQDLIKVVKSDPKGINMIRLVIGYNDYKAITINIMLGCWY